MCTCYSLNVVLVINAGITLRSFGTAQWDSKRTKAPCDRGTAHASRLAIAMPQAARFPLRGVPRACTRCSDIGGTGVFCPARQTRPRREREDPTVLYLSLANRLRVLPRAEGKGGRNGFSCATRLRIRTPALSEINVLHLLRSHTPSGGSSIGISSRSACMYCVASFQPR